MKHVSALYYWTVLGSTAYINDYFNLSSSDWSFVYGTFLCQGYEKSLELCLTSSFSNLLSCDTNSIAGVKCEGTNV